MGEKKELKRSRSRPPKGAPKGTVWFGGPVDRCNVTLRICGENLDPDEITKLMGQDPTWMRRAGTPIRNRDGSLFRIDTIGRWHLSISSEDEDAPSDIEQLLEALFHRLPTKPALWKKVNLRYKVDLFCGLHLYTDNRGFGLSPSICQFISERNILIGFDIYFDPQRRAYLDSGRTPTSALSQK